MSYPVRKFVSDVAFGCFVIVCCLVVLAIPSKADARWPGCTTKDIIAYDESDFPLEYTRRLNDEGRDKLEVFLLREILAGRLWTIPAGSEIEIRYRENPLTMTPPPDQVLVVAKRIPDPSGVDKEMLDAIRVDRGADGGNLLHFGWTLWPSGIVFREEGDPCSASDWASEMHPGAYEDWEPHGRMVRWNQSVTEWSGPDRVILHIESPDDLIHGDRVYTMMVAASSRMGSRRKVKVRAVRVLLWKDHSDIDPKLINQITYAPDGCGWSGDDCIGEAWTDLGWGQIPPRLMAFR